MVGNTQTSINCFYFQFQGYYREGVAFKELSDHFASCLSFFKYLIMEPTSVAVKELFIEVFCSVMVINININRRVSYY